MWFRWNKSMIMIHRWVDPKSKTWPFGSRSSYVTSPVRPVFTRQTWCSIGMSRKNPSFKGKLSWCNGMKRCETMWNAPCYYCEKKSYKCPPMSTEVQTHVEKSLRRCSGIDQWRPLIISPSLRVTRYLWVYCTSSLFHIATSPPRIDTTRTYCTSLSTRQL
jgi:hypothetical protein